MSVDPDIVGEFIDAAVEDQALAERLLIEYPELRSSRWLHQETLLHFLAVEGYIDAVRFLAERGFDVNTSNEFGDPPLIDVVTLGNYEIAEILLAHGANPNAQSETHDNVLHTAVRMGNASLVEMLLAAGAPADYTTALGETVFDALPSDLNLRTAVLDVLSRFGFRPP